MASGSPTFFVTALVPTIIPWIEQIDDVGNWFVPGNGTFTTPSDVERVRLTAEFRTADTAVFSIVMKDNSGNETVLSQVDHLPNATQNNHVLLVSGPTVEISSGYTFYVTAETTVSENITVFGIGQGFTIEKIA
jgi:hypothetical protein